MSGIIVKPFQGYVPPESKVADVITPPYDVLNREEASKLGEERPDCLIHVIRPEIELPGVESTDDAVYQKGKENLHKWIEKELLVKEGKPAFFACKQRLGDCEQRGIAALCSCEQYKQGIIKKHEATREAPERDRTKTTDIQNANVGPVFLAYRGEQHSDLREYVNNLCSEQADRAAHLDFDNTDHELWIVNDEQKIQEIETLFAKVDSLYIADGHHRCASAYNVYEKRKAEAGSDFKGDEPYCYFLAYIFADTELTVIDYNRVVSGVTLTNEELIEKIESNGFEVSKYTGEEQPFCHSFLQFHFARPVDFHTFSLFARGQWYKLVFKGKPKSDAPVDSIDSKILTDFVLTPIFGIVDLRSAPNITFIGGTRGIFELEKEAATDDRIAFAVPPIKMEQLFDVSDSGSMMPPKSTWFVPKLATGLVVRLIE